MFTDESEGTTNQRQRRLPSGDFLFIQKVDDEDTIKIDYALQSDTKQLQPIEFDVIFKQNEPNSTINRTACENYFPSTINETVPAPILKNLQQDQLQDFSICLEYEVAEPLHLIDCTIDGNARGPYSNQKRNNYEETDLKLHI